LGINPHSLRYAFIDYMLSKGLTPEELVVFMGYSSFKHMIIIIGLHRQKIKLYKNKGSNMGKLLNMDLNIL